MKAFRSGLIKKLRVQTSWTLDGAVVQQQHYLKTAAEIKVEAKEAVDGAKQRASQAFDQAKFTAEQVRETVNESAQQPFQQGSDAAGAQSSDRSSSADTDDRTSQAGPQSTDSQGTKQSGQAESDSRGQEGASSSQSFGAQNASQSWGSRLRNAFDIARKEIADAVLPRQETVSATRARDPTIKPAGDPTSLGLTVVKQEESRWRKQWSDMQDKLGLHPFFRKLQTLSDNAAVNKGREMADNIRERWETSDSRFVQRIQDMRDNLMTESEPAQALREIRSRYPEFDMVHFVRALKLDVPVVIKAYLEGNLEALKEHSSPQMMERFTGIINAQKAEGVMPDATILYTSDVELVDIKFVEGDPVVVVQFNCQQINCMRDKFGNVVQGSPNEVQRHYYFWALQQEDAGFVGEDGKFHPPRWQLAEMLIRGQHNLL